MAIPGNVGGKKSTFSSPAAMAQAQRSAEAQSMKDLQDRREQTRQQFFKGREDIPANRLDRRQIQADLYEKFKQEQMKPVLTTSGKPTGAFQSIVPGGPTLADRAQELAFKYGPTPREVFGDIGYGLGSIGKGIGDFIGRGGVIGSVLSDLFGRVKSGAQQGIETVGGLYDNLRKTLGGGEPPVASYGGSSDITVTEQPMFPYNFETIMKPKPDPLLPSEMSQEQFMQSFPELYSSLFQQRNYEPIRVSDMNMTGVTAQNEGPVLQNERPVLPPNVVPMMRIGYPMNIDQFRTPVLNPEITDPRLYQNQVLFAKDGGSVDKYAGLGYKLK